jgi:hypothetical protein
MARSLDNCHSQKSHFPNIKNNSNPSNKILPLHNQNMKQISFSKTDNV